MHVSFGMELPPEIGHALHIKLGRAEIAHDETDGVVDLMGHAGRELADRGQLLGLVELPLGRLDRPDLLLHTLLQIFGQGLVTRLRLLQRLVFALQLLVVGMHRLEVQGRGHAIARGAAQQLLEQRGGGPQAFLADVRLEKADGLEFDAHRRAPALAGLAAAEDHLAGRVHQARVRPQQHVHGVFQAAEFARGQQIAHAELAVEFHGVGGAHAQLLTSPAPVAAAINSFCVRRCAERSPWC